MPSSLPDDFRITHLEWKLLLTKSIHIIVGGHRGVHPSLALWHPYVAFLYRPNFIMKKRNTLRAATQISFEGNLIEYSVHKSSRCVPQMVSSHDKAKLLDVILHPRHVGTLILIDCSPTK